MCEQMADPDRIVVYDTELFAGYVPPSYPWTVMVTPRRHECEQPWDLTEDEAAELGKLTRRLTDAIHKSGSERTYVLSFGEELEIPHFHLALLSRHVASSEGAHNAMWARVEDAKSAGEDLVQVASDFAAAVRANLDLP
jgi:diadenosine tetraphosphate (Ap4A) HIT family hydrolase